jgi:Ca-activated chloride channel family protein
MPIRQLRPAPRRPRRPLARLLVLLALAVAPLAAAPAAPAAPLSPEHQAWLDQVAPIISKAEREAFLALVKEYQRDAFIERFWEVRDPFPDTARNEARDAWESRLVQAQQEFGKLTEDRARLFLLNGPPAARILGQCAGLWPLEVWVYAPSERIPEPLVLVFYQHFGQGEYRIWNPTDGLAALFQFPPSRGDNRQLMNEIANSCVRSDQVAGAIGNVLRKGPMQYSLLVARAERPIEPPSREWVATFNAYSTDLPDDARELPATLSVSFPGRRQNRSILQANLAVPAAEAGTAELGGNRSYNFLLNGEILLGRRLFDAFRYKFDLPAASVASESIPLVFERFLRPGSYTLILKLEDLNGGGFFRAQASVEVPQIDAEPLVTMDDETAKLLAEANAALSTLDNTIQIVQPRGEFQSGLLRFDTLVTGTAIREVAFELDGRPILRKNRPPYSVELDLGEVPRTRNLRAVGFDESGQEVASDEALLNSSPHRFSVRLIEPRRGKKYERSLRAEAEVEVPEDAALERVEFYLNETLIASLYQPPFTQPIVLPPDGAVAYVRAVAYQVDGNSTEDLVFVNAPENLEELEIQFVELYTTVLDRQNRPVGDLEREAFQVAEDGVAQSLTRFERVENLPIHVAVLLDTSASMEESLPAARQAALQFFQQAVTPRDRAALIPFNDRPTLAVRMTNRQEDLGAGLAGLKAERGTALYDSVVFSLFYFNGIKGQRALLVLSDGKDESSRFRFDQTLDFARRAGVAIYTIGLDIPRSELETRKILRTLADETGGRSFFVKDAAELAPIYAAVQQELRSRYLLAYQSTNTERSLKFRSIEVKVDRPGLEAKTLRGYYP